MNGLNILNISKIVDSSLLPSFSDWYERYFNDYFDKYFDEYFDKYFHEYVAVFYEYFHDWRENISISTSIIIFKTPALVAWTNETA